MTTRLSIQSARQCFRRQTKPTKELVQLQNKKATHEQHICNASITAKEEEEQKDKEEEKWKQKKEKGKKKALSFHVTEAKNLTRRMEKGPWCMVSLTQRSPWSSPLSLKTCLPALRYLLHTSRYREDTSFSKGHFLHVPRTCNPSVLKAFVHSVCSFAPSSIIPTNSKYLLEFLSYSNIRNLLHPF